MKNIIRFALVILALGMLAACGSSSSNPVAVEKLTLYATTVGTNAPSNLVLINPTTGAFIKTAGSVGYYVNSITYDKTNKKLYGITTSDDPIFPNGLIEINKTTGVGTPIGNSYVNPLDCPAVNSAGEMFALSLPGGGGSDVLVNINKDTGEVTEIGETNIETIDRGMAFDNNDGLWLIEGVPGSQGVVYSVNTGTGETTYTTFFGDVDSIAYHGDFVPNTASGVNQYIGLDATGTGAKNANVYEISAGTLLVPAPLLATFPSTVDGINAITFGYRTVLVAI